MIGFGRNVESNELLRSRTRELARQTLQDGAFDCDESKGQTRGSITVKGNRRLALRCLEFSDTRYSQADFIEGCHAFPSVLSFLAPMPLPPSVRSLIPLIVGLAVGVVGATLFLQSMPGAEGSPEERANRLEIELRRAQNRIAALEAKLGNKSPGGVLQRIVGVDDPARTLSDGARDLADAIREGRPVSPEDIFRASQPLIGTLAPLFDRMRVKQQKQSIDSMTGELARKYNLGAQQQEWLNQWFEKKVNEEAKAWTAMVANPNTTLEDVMKASRDIRPDAGLDSFMPTILHGEKLEEFRSERLAERVQLVESEADMRVQRLDSVVGLDEGQRDQVFGIMARNSKDYDPQMVLEGAGGQINAAPTGNPQEAMLAVLRPEQREAYEAERKRRRDEAVKDMEAIGLTLPPNWDMFEEPFR